MKKTLVFGASINPHRYSNLALLRLKEYGVETHAFGPISAEAHGVKIQNKIPVIEDLDTITIYMNAKRQEAYYQDIIDLQPKRVIFNPGTENPVFYRQLQEQNIEAEEACTLTLLAIDQY